jgi:hypothetical protein
MAEKLQQFGKRNWINLLICAAYLIGGIALVHAAAGAKSDSQSAYIGGAVTAIAGLLGVVGTISADRRAESARELAEIGERTTVILDLLGIGAKLRAAWQKADADVLEAYVNTEQDASKVKAAQELAKKAGERVDPLREELTQTVEQVKGRVPGTLHPAIDRFAAKVGRGEDATEEVAVLNDAMRADQRS